MQNMDLVMVLSFFIASITSIIILTNILLAVYVSGDKYEIKNFAFIK